MDNIIDLSKLPVSESSSIFNIIALNSNGEVIKSEADFDGYVTKEELEDNYVDNVALTEAIESVNESINTKQDALVSGEDIKTINGESILGSGNIELQSEMTINDITANDIDIKTDPLLTSYNVSEPRKKGNISYLQNEMSDSRYAHTFGFDKTFSAIVEGYFLGDLPYGETTDMCPAWNGTALQFQSSSEDVWSVRISVPYSDASGRVTQSSVEIQSYLGRITISYAGSAGSPSNDKIIANVYNGRLAMIYLNGTDQSANYMMNFMQNGYASINYPVENVVSTVRIEPFNPFTNASAIQSEFGITVTENTTTNVYNNQNVIEGSRYVSETSDNHSEGLNDFIRYNNDVKAYIVTDKNIGQVTYTKSEIDSKIENASGSDITVDSALSTSSTNPVQNKVIAAKVNDITNNLPKSGNGTTVENGVVNISTVASCMPFGQGNAYSLRSTHPEYGIGSTLYSIKGDDTIAFAWADSNNALAQISVNTDVVALKSDIPSEWVGTQAQYDALTSYDSNTTYYIIEEE